MNTKKKQENRKRRHRRVRAKIMGTSKRPRVSVFKSNRHVFIQFIDDEAGKTILSNKITKNQEPRTKNKETKTEKAMKIGETLAQKAKELGIKEVVFDRGGFKYHGRVKAVAEGLKQGGIKL